MHQICMPSHQNMLVACHKYLQWKHESHQYAQNWPGKTSKKKKRGDIIQGMKKDAGCQLFMEVMQRKTAY